MITDLVTEFCKQFPQFNNSLSAGLLVFGRMIGFVKFAPVISRKEFPLLSKMGFAVLMTIVLTTIIGPEKIPVGSSFLLSLLLNIIFGSIIGFTANAIFAAINAGGDMINMQMGLSSAVMFDQSTKSQSSVFGTFLGLFGTVIFIHIGGLFWLIEAFSRSFEVFPVHSTSFPLASVVSMDYLIKITANVLFVGLQIASPVLLATLGQDIILGIISKTAPQVNVFQLSFLFKPIMGAAIMIVILPMLVNIVMDYFLSFSQIY